MDTDQQPSFQDLTPDYGPMKVNQKRAFSGLKFGNMEVILVWIRIWY